MTPEAPPFFTLDRGTAGTAAALVGSVEGRYRLLAATSAPFGVEPEVLLEDLAWRAGRADALLGGPVERWREWPRLEVRTARPPSVCLVAASAQTGRHLEAAFGAEGWDVARTFFGPQPDVVALGGACLDPRLDAVAVAVRGGAAEEERSALRSIWPLVVSIASMRGDLTLLACGTFSERPEAIPEDRLFALPAVEATDDTPLSTAAGQVGTHLSARATGWSGVEGRTGSRAALRSLATLLGSRVEGLEVGAAAGTRSLAHTDREVRHGTFAAGALMPSDLLDDDAVAEDILRWSTLTSDPALLVDRLRELARRPWSGFDREGIRLRLAALRAALSRMQSEWDARGSDQRPEDGISDVVVLGGGAFAGVPAAAAAVAFVDVMRRPGAATILYDHARVLGPLGALSSESDRRRILADLLDDCLLPIGSTLLTGPVAGDGRRSVVLGIRSPLGTEALRLEPGRLRLVDLPPGIVARLELDPREGSVLGVQGRRLTLEVSGGLGGLLVDTRPIPLALPERGERRRALLDGWEQPAWAGAER